MASPTTQESQRHAFVSAAVNLTLGILGSSVLPVPYSISRLGVIPALVLCLGVAAFNSYSGTLLITMARYLRCDTYESVCEAAAGGRKSFRFLAEISLVALLFGTLAGDAALLADMGVLAVTDFFKEGSIPLWLEDNQGRVEMVFLIIFVVFPLSLRKSIRELEKAAAAGLVLVLVLLVVVARAAFTAGFPALTSGELPWFSIAEKKEVPEAVAILSFAFYLQPMLLPLLREMPAGAVGARLTSKALQLVTLGVATVVYLLIGIFAAARFGLKTEGDFLVNKWLSSSVGNGLLDALTAMYLAISMVPMCMTLRYQLDSLVAGGKSTPYVKSREVCFTIAILASSTGVALAMPEAAEKIFSVTGASAVCLVCYVLPIIAHFELMGRGSGIDSNNFTEQQQRQQQQEEAREQNRLTLPLLENSAGESVDDVEYRYPLYSDITESSTAIQWCMNVTRYIVVPLTVSVVGSGFCVSALILSVSAGTGKT